MTIASAVEVVLQSAMAVWLSFWVTAFFSQKYYVKLVVVIGILALLAVYLLIKAILTKVESRNAIDGELILQADAPALWQRIGQMAERLKTAPPDHIVAGIDTNFFVTEAPVTVGDKTLTGRTLFVSIPLLRVLNVAEADAVLGHELAHFQGGDTRDSAALGPKLMQYDQYLSGMLEAGFTVVVYHFMTLYRMIFQLALSRDSREREFLADRTAAKLVSPQAIVQSLVKIAAYSNYRTSTENALYNRDQQMQGSLGIAQSVADGLRPYATSAKFIDDMKTAYIPHPFDSHPALEQRMQNVGHNVGESGYGAIVLQPVAASWADEILTARAIEERMWSVYESQFAQSHDESLAYRYEPANDAEREHVLRYFPPVVFELKKGATVEVNYSGIVSSDGEGNVQWDDVKALTQNDSAFGDSLIATLHEKRLLGSKTVKIKLSGLKKQKDSFNAAVSLYWQRHQVMRQQQAAAQAAQAAT
jgi:Zn-dependent protease with chaperone function